MSATAVPRIKDTYYKEILPRLMKERDYPTPMAVPRLVKVVVNMGVGEARTSRCSTAPWTSWG